MSAGVVVALAVAIAVGAGAPQEDPLRRGRRAFEALQYERAAREFSAVAAEQERPPAVRAQAYLWLGRSLAGMGRSAPAVDAFESAVRLDATVELPADASPKLHAMLKDAKARVPPPTPPVPVPAPPVVAAPPPSPPTPPSDVVPPPRTEVPAPAPAPAEPQALPRAEGASSSSSSAVLFVAAGAVGGVAAAAAVGGVVAELWLQDVPANASRQDIEVAKVLGGAAFVSAGVCGLAAAGLTVAALLE